MSGKHRSLGTKQPFKLMESMAYRESIDNKILLFPLLAFASSATTLTYGFLNFSFVTTLKNYFRTDIKIDWSLFRGTFTAGQLTVVRQSQM